MAGVPVISRVEAAPQAFMYAFCEVHLGKVVVSL
jgi:hypothetical protein